MSDDDIKGLGVGVPGGLAPATIPRLPKLSDDPSLEELTSAAQRLEGVFVSILVEKLREGLSEEALFGSGPGADVYGGLFDRMIGEELAERGGLGIAEMVIRSKIDHVRGEQTEAERNEVRSAP